MAVVTALGRHHRPARSTRVLEVRERLVVRVPDRESSGGDLLRLLELRPEEGGVDLAQEKRRPDIDPAVLRDLATEEAATICAFLVHDLRSLDDAVLVDEQSAALAALHVLRLVKTKGGEVAERSERTTAVARQH